MVRTLKLLAIVSMMTLLPSHLHAGDVDNTPVASLDLSRYLGTWYEIARFDHSFERGMNYVTAEYILKKDGKIEVLNSGWKDDKSKTVRGKAKQPEPKSHPALLKVSFFMFFYSDYRILMLDEDYSAALVGSSSDKYLWVLSRTPSLPQSKLDKIIEEASRRGYDTSRLIWVKQCVKQ